jgi:hypothetical protein
MMFQRAVIFKRTKSRNVLAEENGDFEQLSIALPASWTSIQDRRKVQQLLVGFVQEELQ